MSDNKAKIGSEPAKQTFGNTADKPDNIQENDAGNKDAITSGADRRNYPMDKNGKDTGGSKPENKAHSGD